MTTCLRDFKRVMNGHGRINNQQVGFLIPYVVYVWLVRVESIGIGIRMDAKDTKKRSFQDVSSD